MAYVDTQHNVVTAAAATGLAKWQALRSYFNGGGSTRWELANPADPSTNGLWLTRIGAAADGAPHIVIRRNTAGDTWYISSVVDGAISYVGNDTNPTTVFGSAEADYELNIAHTPNTGYTKMVVIEHDDALSIGEYTTSAENAFDKAIHAGILYVHSDPALVDAIGSRGNGVLTNQPSLNSVGTPLVAWTGAAPTTLSTVKLLGEDCTLGTLITDGTTAASDTSAGACVAHPIPMQAKSRARSAYFAGVTFKWLRFVSADAAGGGNPGTRYEVGGTDGWLRFGATASTSNRLCLNCQYGKAVH